MLSFPKIHKAIIIIILSSHDIINLLHNTPPGLTIRMPFRDIKRALLDMDDGVLQQDRLAVLAGAVPTPQECTLLRGYKARPVRRAAPKP